MPLRLWDLGKQKDYSTGGNAKNVHCPQFEHRSQGCLQGDHKPGKPGMTVSDPSPWQRRIRLPFPGPGQAPSRPKPQVARVWDPGSLNIRLPDPNRRHQASCPQPPPPDFRPQSHRTSRLPVPACGAGHRSVSAPKASGGSDPHLKKEHLLRKEAAGRQTGGRKSAIFDLRFTLKTPLTVQYRKLQQDSYGTFNHRRRQKQSPAGRRRP